MKPTCPRCRKPIPPDQISMATKTFAIPDLLGEVSEPVDSAQLPKGVRYEEWADGFRLTVSHRSSVALGLILFTVFWCYQLLTVFLGTPADCARPAWFTASFWIFFLYTTLSLSKACLFMLFGYSSVESSGGTGRVTRRIGPFRSHREFRSADVMDIEFQPPSGDGETSARAALLLSDGKRIPVPLPWSGEAKLMHIAVLRRAFFGRGRH